MVLLDLIAGVGAVVGAYRTAKVLAKSRVRAGSDADGAPVPVLSVTSPSSMSAEADVLRFYVMLGMVQFLHSYGFPYASEVRAALVLMLFLPSMGSAVRPLYSNVAEPALSKLSPPVATQCSSVAVFAQTYTSKAFRVVFVSMMTSLGRYMTDDQVAQVADSVSQCRDAVDAELRVRDAELEEDHKLNNRLHK